MKLKHLTVLFIAILGVFLMTSCGKNYVSYNEIKDYFYDNQQDFESIEELFRSFKCYDGIYYAKLDSEEIVIQADERVTIAADEEHYNVLCKLRESYGSYSASGSFPMFRAEYDENGNMKLIVHLYYTSFDRIEETYDVYMLVCIDEEFSVDKGRIYGPENGADVKGDCFCDNWLVLSEEHYLG